MGGERPSGRYVYGVLASGEARDPQERGVFGEPVGFVERDGLAAAVSAVEGPVPGRREDLMAHFHVLEELGRKATVLPLRFGTLFDGEDQVVSELLVRRRGELEDLLREVDGMVELSVKAIYDEASVMAEILAGRRDIRRLRERTRALPEDATYFDRIRLGELVAGALAEVRERDAEAIVGALSPLASRVVSNPPTMEWIAVSASFLVPRTKVSAFEDRAGSIGAKASARMRLRVTGPIPPYSFVALEEQMAETGGR